MARPAGYSSEEDSDEGLSFAHDVPKQKNYFKREKDEEMSINDKLIAAVVDRKIDELQKLLTEDVNLNYKSKTIGNWNALMEACSQGSVKIVELLLKSGANPNDHFQLTTPLLCACNSSANDELAIIKCVTLLIEYGASLNSKDWQNIGALSYAVRRNREKLVLKLLSIGYNVDSEDTDGWTPIFYAVDGEHANLVQILKDAGANIKHVDNQGRTLYDIATTKYYKDIAEMVNTTEKLVDIDDIIDSYRDYKWLSNYERVLSELPDKSKGRFHGFPCDAARWINGIGLDTLVKLFMSKNIQLGQILTMSDKQLKNIGVVFSYDRKKIGYCVQNFHEHSWGKQSLKQIKEDINLFVTTEIICNAIKQLHIVSTSTYFWKINDGHNLCTNKRDCINTGLYYTKHLYNEINAILKIIRQIEEVNDIRPCDLIRPRSEVSKWFNKKTLFITAVILTVLYKNRKYIPLLNTLQVKFPYQLKC